MWPGSIPGRVEWQNCMSQAHLEISYPEIPSPSHSRSHMWFHVHSLCPGSMLTKAPITAIRYPFRPKHAWVVLTLFSACMCSMRISCHDIVVSGKNGRTEVNLSWIFRNFRDVCEHCCWTAMCVKQIWAGRAMLKIMTHDATHFTVGCTFNKVLKTTVGLNLFALVYKV